MFLDCGHPLLRTFKPTKENSYSSNFQQRKNALRLEIRKARLMAQVCCRSPAENVGSNLAGGMDVCLVVLSGKGLCDELITRPEESYRL
jgi:hypothetical protein